MKAASRGSEPKTALGDACRSIGEAFAVSVFVSYDRLVGWKLIEASGASLLRMAINGKMSICI